MQTKPTGFMGSTWETIELAASSPIVEALSGFGNLKRVYKAGVKFYKVNVWLAGVMIGVDFEENTNRTQKCSICGEEGHNRRTCAENVTCQSCNNNEPEEVYEANGKTVCNQCI